MPSFVRDQIPGTLNLGFSKNSPLVMLAGIQEILTDVRPKTVVWMHTEGFVFRLAPELPEYRSRYAEFFRYLSTPEHRQGVLGKQEYVDESYKSFVIENIDAQAEKQFRNTILSIALLREIRHRLGISARPQRGQEPVTRAEMEARFDLYFEILRRARDEVERWGGEMVFVYTGGLSYELYGDVTGVTPDTILDLCTNGELIDSVCEAGWTYEGMMKNEVLRTAKELGLPIVDIKGELARREDPFQFLPLRTPNHYNAEGNKESANLIMTILNDGKDEK